MPRFNGNKDYYGCDFFFCFSPILQHITLSQISYDKRADKLMLALASMFTSVIHIEMRKSQIIDTIPLDYSRCRRHRHRRVYREKKIFSERD